MADSKQYRISPVLGIVPKRYQLRVTYGLMNVETLGFFLKQAEARIAAKAHAARNGWTAIILT